MSLRIARAGLQTTVQAGARRGVRHLGVPSGGAADPVSLALANRLVGNAWDAPALELTLTGAAVAARTPISVALAGAPCEARVDGQPVPMHRTLPLRPGAVLDVGPARRGVRTYLAVTGGLVGTEAFGSVSTYLPGGFGGHEGRALREGDEVSVRAAGTPPVAETPPALRLPFAGGWTLRAVPGPEHAPAHDALFGPGWRASRAADRTGVRLGGPALPASGDAGMDSVATLVGTVQAPPGGAPILLGVEGGTTGGYPRAAQVVRADRHLIGQVRPGDAVRLLRWEATDADAVLEEKRALLRAWVGDQFAL